MGNVGGTICTMGKETTKLTQASKRGSQSAPSSPGTAKVGQFHWSQRIPKAAWDDMASRVGDALVQVTITQHRPSLRMLPYDYRMAMSILNSGGLPVFLCWRKGPPSVSPTTLQLYNFNNNKQSNLNSCKHGIKRIVDSGASI